MTVPLVILAVLSFFGGWVNVPPALSESALGFFGALPMSEWLHHWLEPVTAMAHEVRLEHVGDFAHDAPFGGGELMWAATSTLLALVVVGVAFAVVGRWKVLPATETAEPAGFKRVLFNKWYVDELYDRIVVRPVLATSRFFWRFVDDVIIDGTVNAGGNLARAFGWFGSLFQTGTVNTYAFVLTLGVLAILGVVALG